MMRGFKNTDTLGFKRFFSYKGRSPTPKRLQEIQREKIKIMLLYPVKNNLRDILIFVFLVCFFITLIILVPFSDFLWEFIPDPYSFYIFLFLYISLYAFTWFTFYRIASDGRFYASYYNTWAVVVRHLSSKNEGKKSDLNLDLFQLNYNMLRKSLKNRIRLLRANFLTYDYEISRINRDIDTFFDATTKILFRRKVMATQFFPHDEYDISMKETEIQSQLSDYRWQNTKGRPPGEYELEAREGEGIDYRTIDVFLQYFGDIIIRKPRKKAMNTAAIGELFRSWNSIVEKINKDIFEESKNDVEKFYDERQERRSLLLKTLFELSVLLMVGIISGLLVYYFTI